MRLLLPGLSKNGPNEETAGLNKGRDSPTKVAFEQTKDPTGSPKASKEAYRKPRDKMQQVKFGLQQVRGVLTHGGWIVVRDDE